MFTMKGQDGKPIFNTIRVGLSCEACQKAGTPTECTHMSDITPPWKSSAKLSMVKQIYGDQKDLLARESMGLVTEDNASVFPMQKIEAILKREVDLSPPQFLYLAYDPNGGGSSCASLVAFTLERLQVTIVSMDTHACRTSAEMEQFLKQHVAAIRGDSRFRDSWIILIAESNLGQEASHAHHFLKDYRRIWAMSEKGRPGVNTTHERKELMVNTLLLFVNQEAVALYKNLISANPFVCAKSRRAKVLDEFKKQWANFRKVVTKPKESWKLPRIVYTGKLKGSNDDIIMTLLFGVWWSQRFVNREVLAPYSDFNE